MLCERLGELGLPIGPDTARDILRAVLAAEAPRMDAHIREALQTSIDTIRVAAQSANGVLASTVPVRSRTEPRTPKPVLDPAPRRATPAAPAPRPTPSRRPAAKRLGRGHRGRSGWGKATGVPPPARALNGPQRPATAPGLQQEARHVAHR